MAFDTYITFPTASAIQGEAGSDAAELKALKSGFGAPIQLSNFSFGGEMAATQSRSDVGGATTGRAKFKNASCEANLDKAGGPLAFHSAAGTVFSKVQVHMFISVNDEKNGEQKSLQMVELFLYDVIIATYELSIGGGDDLPTMSFELSVGGFFMKYHPLDPATKTTLLNSAHKGGWNALANTEKQES